MPFLVVRDVIVTRVYVLLSCISVCNACLYAMMAELNSTDDYTFIYVPICTTTILADKILIPERGHIHPH